MQRWCQHDEVSEEPGYADFSNYPQSGRHGWKALYPRLARYGWYDPGPARFRTFAEANSAHSRKRILHIRGSEFCTFAEANSAHSRKRILHIRGSEFCKRIPIW